MQQEHAYGRQSLVVDYSGGGTRYVLPRRQLAGIRHAGWFLFGFGGFVAAFMIGWMWMPIAGGIEELQKGQAFGWAIVGFGCLGIFGLIPALGMLMSGIAIAFNRTSCVVDLRNGVLRTKERFLLASWRRKRKAERVERLRVSLASEWKGSDDREDVSAWLADSEAALVAEMADGKEFLVAVGYPRELLLQLAQDLAPRLQAEITTASAVVERDRLDMDFARPVAKAVEVFEGQPERKKNRTRQPDDSTATIERRPFGITIDIPPAGIWKGSRGLMFFSLIWNGFMAIFIGSLVLSLAGIDAVNVDGDPRALLLFSIPFVAAGVAITLAAINMGRRRATIATADDLLMIVRHTIFGKSTREWSSERIDKITVGNSGMEVNNVPVKELQIHARNSKKFGCLSQLDEEELKWIAGELKQALNIRRSRPGETNAADYSERNEAGYAVPAPGSRISVDYAADGTHIDVPAQGIARNLAGMIFGLVLMAIAGGVVGFVGIREFQDGIDRSEWILVGFISMWTLLFGGVGALTFFSALIGTSLRFTITAERYRLTVVRRAFLFKRTFTWERDALEPITVKSTGTKVNDRTYYQVSIAPHQGKRRGIMWGHDRCDLEFVAAAINESLRLAKAEAL